MSLLFIDSFDHYTNLDDKWDGSSFGGNMKPIQGAGRFGGAALQIKASAGGGLRSKSIITTQELIVGFAVLMTTDHAVGIDFSNAGDPNVFDITIDPASGVITMNFDSGAETIATATSTVTEDTWFYIELRAKAHASLGEMEIRVNNVVKASATGLDLSVGADLEEVGIRASNNLQLAYIDSLYILDTLGTSNNTFIGDSRVVTLYPGADGILNQFSPSTIAADNFTMTNETLFDDDTTFVESGIVGAKESYDNQSLADAGISPGTIFGVQVVNASKKTDAAELRYRDQMVIAGVHFDDGVDTTATASIYKMTTMIRDTDPSDDATWTESKVAAVGSGIEIVFRQI